MLQEAEMARHEDHDRPRRIESVTRIWAGLKRHVESRRRSPPGCRATSWCPRRS
ncbi:MAG TPA: hypothetical protein VFT75_00475 [Nocardioidaceae bacterium]|nr:hypothetical protein [Nocardioidaceae bacterium]